MLRAVLQGYRRAIRRPAFRRSWLGMMISRAGDAFTWSLAPPLCATVEFTGAAR